MATPVRPPAVAGQFYPANPEVLQREIRNYTDVAKLQIAALGCIVPHAGYMYSGRVAGAVYGRLDLPRRFIILCPNHTGAGAPLGIMRQGIWTTPLGEAPIDSQLAAELQRQYPYATEDIDSQRREHAIEVQIPFLQALTGNFSFVPVTIGTAHFEYLHGLGQAIARALETTSEKVLIIASSDMNHYESDAVTRVKDRKAIEKVLALDPRGLYEVVVRENISMCGFGPAVTMLTAAKDLGAKSAELIKYATSADVSHDTEWCVGYAGIVVT